MLGGSIQVVPPPLPLWMSTKKNGLRLVILVPVRVCPTANESAHLATAFQEQVDQMAANETSGAGYQSPHDQVPVVNKVMSISTDFERKATKETKEAAHSLARRFFPLFPSVQLPLRPTPFDAIR